MSNSVDLLILVAKGKKVPSIEVSVLNVESWQTTVGVVEKEDAWRVVCLMMTFSVRPISLARSVSPSLSLDMSSFRSQNVEGLRVEKFIPLGSQVGAYTFFFHGSTGQKVSPRILRCSLYHT